MNLETEFRRFQDFGLVIGLLIGVTAITIVWSAVLPLGCLLWARLIATPIVSGIAIVGFLSCGRKAFSPNVPSRTIGERVVAGIVVGSVFSVCTILIWLLI